jgi:hypothetical protein
MGYLFIELKPQAKHVTAVSVLLILHCKAIVFDWQFKFAKL